MALRLLVVALAACSVPDVALEGKLCPCTGDYMCGVDMRCHARIDAGKKDAPPASGSCLGTDPGGILVTDSFDGALTFTTDGGTWTQSGGALQQTDASAGLAFAYTTNPSVNLSTYRVVSAMSGTTPGTAMGISVRIASGQKTRYDCLWEPGTSGTLLWQSTNNGGNATTMGTPVVTTTTEQVTMEVLAAGSTLKCCIDNVANASITVTNPSPNYAMGLPGVVVNDMKASFADFTVYAN